MEPVPAGGERDDHGDSRDQAAKRRDVAGGLRDRDGMARDLRGDERDRAAESRDRAAVASERSWGSEVSEAERHRSAQARTEAAFDRSRASEDRKAGAEDRARAVADRMTASADRHVALGNRSASAVDRELAAVDDLTGAHLRGAGLDELKREMDRARRTGESLGLAFVDVDHLKDVNDSAGHAGGDRVLTEVVRALRSRLRSYDLVVRVGGDEFLCVLPGLDLDGTVRRLAGLNTLLSGWNESAAVTIGIAQMLPGDTPDGLIMRADADLYRQRAERRASARWWPRTPAPMTSLLATLTDVAAP